MVSAANSRCALILPGAVAKGAFEAGVIDVLAKRDVKIDRIVATSSGALNGVAFTAGIRAGKAQEMAAKLVASWIENGDWSHTFRLKPTSLLRGRGVSGAQGILAMLRGLVQPCTETVKHEVELRIIVAPLNGVLANIGGKMATTYEKVLVFSGSDFDSAEGLEKVFAATTAACAFPGLFAPVDLDGLGPCIDGGAVNNAPIKYALDESDVGRLIVPIPFPEVIRSAKRDNGLAMLNQLVEILINERLFRDLRDAQIVNKSVHRVDRLAADGVLSPDQATAVKHALEIRRVQITEVRPRGCMQGSPFSGFFSKKQRICMIEDGRAAAETCLNHVESEGDPQRRNPVE